MNQTLSISSILKVNKKSWSLYGDRASTCEIFDQRFFPLRQYDSIKANWPCGRSCRRNCGDRQMVKRTKKEFTDYNDYHDRGMEYKWDTAFALSELQEEIRASKEESKREVYQGFRNSLESKLRRI